MNTELRQKLRSVATEHAESHPIDMELALTAGIRRYQWKVLSAYATVTAAVTMLAVVMLLTKVGQDRDVELAAVTVSAVPDELEVGESSVLVAQLTFSDGSTAPATEVEWVSADPSVAGVDGSGTVTAVIPGTVSISATQSGVTGTVIINVATPPVTGVPTPSITDLATPPVTDGTVITELVITPSIVPTQAVGGTSVLVAQLVYSDGSTALATEVEWDSADWKVAGVDEAGTVTAIGPGTVIISATQSGVTGTATITVAQPITGEPIPEPGEPIPEPGEPIPEPGEPITDVPSPIPDPGEP
ncbi:Ig-like domain-containing protein [Arthrobacter sp. ZGTC212]|uniref:Ig-like domain-containing protein n=1 Tax=Arthrobacter sp. ZGTC212 TaxID=2058899 RepID=UPI000CE42301|nr:Ig-like domain-containing protein [Arthrobacter sp. ZGTC212]